VSSWSWINGAGGTTRDLQHQLFIFVVLFSVLWVVIIKFELGFLCHELNFILFRERLFNRPTSQPRVHLKEDDDQSDDVRLHSCLPLPASH